MFAVDFVGDEKNSLITGRASAAIWLILKANNISGSFVIVPSNICYAAVLPIVYSGNKPLFIDVEKSGNVGFKDIAKKTKEVDNISAIVLPHMFGNPCLEIEKIVEHCQIENILVIEDCAAALGAKIGKRYAGEFGDYSIFSFGFSKTIDLGNGGMIFSSRDLSKCIELNNQLPVYTPKIEKELSFFSKLYRLIRNSNLKTEFTDSIYSNFIEKHSDNFLYQLSYTQVKETFFEFKEWTSVVNMRIKRVEQYKKNLRFNDLFIDYKFNEGAVPWRYNVFVSKKIRTSLIQFLLEKNVPVSDWYPCVVNMFGENEEDYPVAREFGAEILNFPLMVSESEINRICGIINLFFDE